MDHASRPFGRALLLALFVILLNPALCVLHCLALEGGSAPGTGGHALHSAHEAAGHALHNAHGAHTAAKAAPTQAAGQSDVALVCAMAQALDEDGGPLPRALYELTPIAALAVAFALAMLGAPPAPGPARRPLTPPAPPSPPPRLCF